MRSLLTTSPFAALCGLWKKIPRIHKVTFAFTYGAFLLVNIVKLTGFNLDHDSLTFFGRLMDNTGQGRWFLRYSSILSGFNNIPWANGLLAGLYLALTACLLVDILSIRRGLAGGLIGLTLASYPIVSVIFAYLFAADSFVLSILLTVFAVWLCKRLRFGFLLAAIPLAVSLGIYQAYLPLAASLLVLLLILQLLENQLAVKQLLLNGVKYFASLVGGFGLYYLILKLVLALRPGVSLGDYKGMSTMGQIDPSTIGRQVLDAYREFFGFHQEYDFFPFWFPGSDDVMRLTVLLGMVIALAMLGLLAWRAGAFRAPGRALLLAGLVLAWPLATNAIYIMVPNPSDVSLMTRLPMIAVPILALCMLDRLDPELPRLKPKALQITAVGLCWLQIALTLLQCYNYHIIINEAYVKEEAAHQQAYGFAVSLVQRIEDHPEYTPGMPVRIIGKVDFEDFPEDFFRRSGLTAYRNGEDIINYFRYDNFIRIYLGKSFDYAFAADDWTGEWYTAHQAEIDAMPPYPQAGGMRVMDGKLYIKFGEVA